MSTWHTTTTAIAQWADAATIKTETLDEYLTAAREQCEAYGVFEAPANELPGWIPERFRIAQLMQARDLWNATAKKNGTDDSSGYGEYALPVYQMTNTVKGLLRPRRGGIGLG